MNGDPALWFTGWDRLVEIALGALWIYVLVIVLVRIMGKRTTSQLNNFDWIITVAVGSLAATGILSESVALLDATVAIVTLGLCQWVVTWLAVRSDAFQRMVRARPRLLVHHGRFLEDAMKRERISRAEIEAKLREEGLSDPRDAAWVVMETDGHMSVVPTGAHAGDDSPLLDGVATGGDGEGG